MFLYIDDILIVGNDQEIIEEGWLSSSFEMKNIGKARYMLSVKILIDCKKKLHVMFQEIYIRKILECLQMQSCKTIDTLIAEAKSLSLDMCPKTLEDIEKVAQVQIYAT